MAITAKDIQEQGFEHSRRGYDVEEVDIFLERVAEEVDNLIRQNHELRARLAEASNVKAPAPEVVVDDTKLREYEAQIRDLKSQQADYERKVKDLQRKLDEKGEDASTISAAIISAQKSADTIREEARIEGEKIYKEAEAKAREIVRDALSDKQQTLVELERLRDSRARFREEYEAMLKRFIEDASKEFKPSAGAAEKAAQSTKTQAEQEREALTEVRAAAARNNAGHMVPAAEDYDEPPMQQSFDTAPAEIVTDISDFGDTDDYDIDEID